MAEPLRMDPKGFELSSHILTDSSVDEVSPPHKAGDTLSEPVMAPAESLKPLTSTHSKEEWSKSQSALGPLRSLTKLPSRPSAPPDNTLSSPGSDIQSQHHGDRSKQYSKHYSLPNLGRVGSVPARNKICKWKGVPAEKELPSGNKKYARRTHPEDEQFDQIEEFAESLAIMADNAAERAARALCSNKMPLISSTNHLVMRWHIVLLVAMLFVASFVPFDAAFLEPQFLSKGNFAASLINRMLDLVFIMDMILTFNVAVPDTKNPGSFVRDRIKIAKMYFQGWFLIDLISVFPFDAVSLGFNMDRSDVRVVKLLRVLRLAKLLRLLRANRVLLYIETHQVVDYGNVQLASFVMAIFCMIHWLGCGWYLIIETEQNEVCVQYPFNDFCCYNWLDCADVYLRDQAPSIPRSYLLAVTWSTGEVLTVGSSIEATTVNETIYSLFAQVLSGVAYAYLLGALCNIFAAKTRNQTKFFESMDKLNNYLTENGVTKSNKELCVSLRTFFRYAYARNDGDADVLDTLTPVLQGNLAYQVHSKWINLLFPGVFELCVNLPDAFYYAFALRLKLHLFAPLESVVQAHHNADTVFIIHSGVIMTRRMQLRRSGDVVGEDAIGADWEVRKRGYTATALTHGRVYSISVADMMEIMERPQYAEFLQPAFRHISMLRAASALLFISQAILKAIKFSNNLYVACQMLGEDIHFVSQDAMPGFMAILVKAYFHVSYGLYGRTKVLEELELTPDLPSGFKQSIVHEWKKFDESDQHFLHTTRQRSTNSNADGYDSGASIESSLLRKSSFGPLARVHARRQAAKILNAINQSNQDLTSLADSIDASQEYDGQPSTDIDTADGHHNAQSTVSQCIDSTAKTEISTGVSALEANPLLAKLLREEEPVNEEQKQLDSKLERVQSKSMGPTPSTSETDQIFQQMGTLRDEVREMRTEIHDMRALIIRLGSALDTKIHTGMYQSPA